MRDKFDYEEGFMGVRGVKPKTHKLSFKEDYRLRSLVQNVSLSKGRLLDIGCGGGRFTESIPYYFPKVNIYGCDVSNAAISYANKFGSGKIKYGVIKNKKLPYEDNFFDACICFDVLEHVSDVGFFLREVRRIMKNDGQFFLIVPCEGERFTYTWLFQKLHLQEDLTFRYLGHIHPELTHKKIIALLQKHGFLIQAKAYSEHLLYQFIQFFVLFMPKILLEIILGKSKANEYTNSSLVKTPKNHNEYILKVRNYWYKIWDFMMFYPMNWETRLLRKIPFAAWKLQVLTKK